MNLESTALALVAPRKGILAADESFPTIGKRFAALGVANTEENRRAYRELLLTTSPLEEYISGVILFDETLRQRTAAGVPFPDSLVQRDIIPGIKVDKGTVPLAGFPGEKITAGLDGLRERLAEYHQLGARFTKWRAVFAIGDDRPSRLAIHENARSLASFAALSQEAGLVPIVEPELLMDGGHSLARSEELTHEILLVVFQALAAHRVKLEGLLLKTAMALPGTGCALEASAGEIAAATLRCLRRAVPAAVPGIVFLSGGQSAELATERLNAIARTAPAPWALSFSFGRALQSSALQAWQGKAENVPAAQAALQHRAACNSAAVQGTYTAAREERP